MDQMSIHYGDVLMNMFMYSLEGDALQWYRSLLVSSISSLREFHACFHKHCSTIFSIELLFEDYCDHFELKESTRKTEWDSFYDGNHLTYSQGLHKECNKECQTMHEGDIVPYLTEVVYITTSFIHHD